MAYLSQNQVSALWDPFPLFSKKENVDTTDQTLGRTDKGGNMGDINNRTSVDEGA
jgi:hypothetical protein